MGARVVRLAAGAYESRRIHCAGAISRLWKKRSSGSTSLSYVFMPVPTYALAAAVICRRLLNASCASVICAPLVKPIRGTRCTVLQYSRSALCLVAACAMNKLVWPGPYAGRCTKQ